MDNTRLFGAVCVLALIFGVVLGSLYDIGHTKPASTASSSAIYVCPIMVANTGVAVLRFPINNTDCASSTVYKIELAN